MKISEGVKRIEELIKLFAKEEDEVYLELLEEMVERAKDSLHVRRDELTKNGGEEEWT